MKFYSQYEQDETIYNMFFKDKKDGFFLEIGADDGIRFSNCNFFEETLGWNGIAVEARDNAFEDLKKNRNCICEKAILSDVEEVTDFQSISGYGLGLSGIISKYDPRHLEVINKGVQHKDNKGHEIIQVETTLLSKLLEKHNVTKIDFLSIDTEGSELAILKTIDFNKIFIDVITIEDNYNNPELLDFFKKRNYRLVKTIKCDKIFKLNNN